jgi:hypothetical protein
MAMADDNDDDDDNTKYNIYHSFGIKYSNQKPEDNPWQLILISTHRSFLTQYITTNVHYLLCTLPS